jgi:hypothetical protein
MLSSFYVYLNTGVWWSKGLAPLILNLGIKFMRVVNTTLWRRVGKWRYNSIHSLSSRWRWVIASRSDRFPFECPFINVRSWGRSVSIVSDYRLDNQGSIPGKRKDFSSSLCVHTGAEAHPASCTMDTGGPFPEVKCGRGVTQTTHPHLVPRWSMSSYTPLPLVARTIIAGRLYLSFINVQVIQTIFYLKVLRSVMLLHTMLHFVSLKWLICLHAEKDVVSVKLWTGTCNKNAIKSAETWQWCRNTWKQSAAKRGVRWKSCWRHWPSVDSCLYRNACTVKQPVYTGKS